jgi:CelD/BcsL family acetyltransferase involved in cellulose biosynthesis
MRVLVVREGRKAIAIAPLMKSRVSMRGLPVDVLGFMAHPETQIADILLRDAEASTDALRVILRFLLKERASDWQMISLDKIPPDSKSLHLLSKLSDFSSLRYKIEPGYEAPFISLRDGWEHYLRSRSPRFRKTVRNVANRMNRLGQVEVLRFGRGQDIQQGIEKLFSVSDASWKVANGIAITSSTERQSFFRGLAQISADRGGLEIWILEANGIPIASETQIRDGVKIYALRCDYDERYADQSPGSYLQAEILKVLFNGPCEEYNFGIGRNSYKMKWTNEECSLLRFTVYNQTLYGSILRSISRFAFREVAGSFFKGKETLRKEPGGL